MPLLRVNAQTIEDDRTATLGAAAQQAQNGAGPIIIMLHGYKYQPGHAWHCPHISLFSEAEHGWPAGLGFGTGDAQEGLGVAFGWQARGTLRAVYRRAARAGDALAALINTLHKAAPHRPIHLMAHSMGSEVIFRALPMLDPGRVRRIISLTGASFAQDAMRAMRSPAGQSAELINVVSRENDLFDLAFASIIGTRDASDRPIGYGLSARNIATLQLDQPAHLNALARLGSPIAPPQRHICHWSGYTRPGALALWSRALRDPAALPLHLMAPTAPTPCWSGLRPRFLAPRTALLQDSPKPAT